MIELDLDAIEARAARATQGPWKLWGMAVMADPMGTSNVDDALLVADTHSPGLAKPRTFNASFIAHARADVPALVAEVRCLRREVAALLAVANPTRALGLEP